MRIVSAAIYLSLLFTLCINILSAIYLILFKLNMVLRSFASLVGFVLYLTFCVNILKFSFITV